MPDLAPIRAHLDRCRANLLAVCESVPADRWQQSPGSNKWSAAEVVAHLTLVEQAITDGARKLAGAEPKHFTFWQRLHPPVQVVAWRGVKRESPIPMDRSLLGAKQDMLARLVEARVKTTALLEENRDRDLRRWRWRHPFLGAISYYDWFRVIGYHELRHAKQIREIVDSLPK